MLTWIFLVLLTGSIMALDINGTCPKKRSKRSLSDSPPNEIDRRVSRDLSPYHYNVELKPMIYTKAVCDFNYYGTVSIYFTVINVTSLIAVNARGLDINGTLIKVTAVPGQSGAPTNPVVSNWSVNEEADLLEVKLAERLARHTKYILTVTFSGHIYFSSEGFFWDYYVNSKKGEVEFIGATHFQNQGGRVTIPSFDEPYFKATFNTTIVYRPPFVSFANMPRIRTIDRGNNWSADYFATTPKMSLHAFGIAVGDFHRLDAESFNGYQVGIVSRPEVIPLMGFAQEIAPMIQAWLDCETGITYREPKLDHILFPSQPNALENWGLIVYREHILSISPETSSTFGKYIAAGQIAFETAQLWYGNLVTCNWWNDAWLIEGFGRYYEYRATQVLGWEGSEASQVNIQTFLEVDQRNTSDPVRVELSAALYSDTAFIENSYIKAGAMVQFLEGILTTYTFKRGLKKYLLKYQYGTATTDDLWQLLNEQASVDNVTNPDGSPLNVKLRMDPWLNQIGFPLISVTRRTDGTAVVTQSHFLRPPNQIINTTSPYNYRWHVPITVISADSGPRGWDAAPSAYIDIDKNKTIVSGFPKNLSKWAMINAKAMFYYRVMYDNVSFAAIVSQLLANKNEIHVQSRSQFIDDAFSVARAGYFPETRAMNSTLYLKRENEWGPWNSALRHLGHSDRLIRNLSWGGLQRSYILGLAQRIYGVLGWNYSESETPFRHFLRRDIINVTCSYGYDPCLEEARSQYALFKRNASANVVNPNNLPTVLCVGIREGNETDFQMLYDKYLKIESSVFRDERHAYLFGCSCTKNQTLLERLLTGIRTDKVNPKDVNDLAYFLSQNDYGAQILWDFLDSEWDAVPYYGLLRDNPVRNIAMGFSTRAQLNELYNFTERHRSRFKRFYKNLFLDAEANVKWVETQGRALKDWLRDHQPTE